MRQKRYEIRPKAVIALAALATMFAQPVFGQEHHHEHMGHDHVMMDHSQHVMPAQGVAVRSTASYDLPNVTLTDMNGNRVGLPEAVSDGPVLVNFIYTTCTTVCPPMSATFAEVQDQLAAEGKTARMISISIDPEHDTPARLKAYAERFKAGKEWQFLTGSHAESVAVQRAFHAYRGNKMNHAPLTLVRTSARAPWVRIEGFASAADLVNEIRSHGAGVVSRH